jgi:hypothetical protein
MAYATINLDMTNFKGFEKELMKIIRDELNRAFKEAEPKINNTFRLMLLDEIKNCKEFASLRDDTPRSLKGELGVVNPEEKINALLDLWSKQFYVQHNNIHLSHGGLAGGFELNAIHPDYIEAGAIGQFVSENGFTVPWLEWLALAGNKYVIANYMVRFARIPRSRTGLALMVRSKKSSYRVNPQFSGHVDNNFITRSFGKIMDKVPSIINKEIQDAL